MFEEEQRTVELKLNKKVSAQNFLEGCVSHHRAKVSDTRIFHHSTIKGKIISKSKVSKRITKLTLEYIILRIITRH